MRALRSVVLLAVAALALTGCGKGIINAKRIEAASPGDWLTYGRTYDEQRFSPLTQITAKNVSKLRP